MQALLVAVFGDFVLGCHVSRGSQDHQEIATLGMEILGRLALARSDVDGAPTQEMLHDYFWALQFTISGGTSQVQRNIIAERILGLPREPRP